MMMKLNVYRSESEIYVDFYRFGDKKFHDHVVIKKEDLSNKYLFNKVERSYKKIIRGIKELKDSNEVNYKKSEVHIRRLKGKEFKLDSTNYCLDLPPFVYLKISMIINKPLESLTTQTL